MSREKELLDSLLGTEGEEPSPSELDTPFAQQLAAALSSAVAYMRGEGIIEMEDDFVEDLVTELTCVGIEAHSPKQMLKRMTRTLLHSDHVEEVFGTDDAIAGAVQRFLAPE